MPTLRHILINPAGVGLYRLASQLRSVNESARASQLWPK
jgi:hypothetical protein